MLKNHIKRQVLVPLTLTFILLVASFLYASYRIRTQDYDLRLTNRYERVQTVLQSLLTSRTSSMQSVVEFIAEQRRFQNAMQERDRQLLLQHGSVLLDRLYHQQQITHFYFHDSAGRNFLRVYQPDNLAESPHRFTMSSAMESGRPVAGLELGGNGTFTLRLVYPWRVEGELLGYIELGQEIDPILREIKAITNIDFLVVINKTFLERESWEEGMRMLERNADWNLLDSRVLIDTTVAMTAAETAELFDDDAIYRSQGAVVGIAERTYRSRAFPLADVAGRIVGDFVLLDDMTDNVAAFRTFITQIVVFSLVLSTGLFAFAYRVLGRLDARLADSQRRVQEELENQARTTARLEVEVVERRRAEKDLTRLNEHLEQRVLERTSELQSLNQEIEAGRRALEIAYRDLQAKQATILQQDKMACVGQLAAGVAHDINNPIGFVAGNLEVLDDFWAKASAFIGAQNDVLHGCASGAEAESLEAVRRKLRIDYVFAELPLVMKECFEGIERVNRIVLNLKGFSRSGEAEAQPADIHACLDSTIGIVWNELRYKADVIKDYGELPQLLCYPQQLNQVFMNLLINAAQAIERWGEICITTRVEDQHICVAISDTGAGIAPDDIPHVFEPFFTTKDSGVGTGLGLSIVYDIIKKHRGEIDVTSERHKGTVFTVRLPIDGPEISHA
ncbi:MAG: ATP-binding protein [Pelovirga sp.]